MLVVWLSTVSGGSAELVTIELPEKSAWPFFGAHGSRHFFIDPLIGSILLVDFLQDQFDVSVIKQSPSSDSRCQMPLFEGKVACLSAWTIGDDLFTLSAATGQQMVLGPPGGDAEVGQPEPKRPLDIQSRVWAESQRVMSNVRLVELANGGNCSGCFCMSTTF